MNTLTPLFNRDGQLPADAWFHLVPRGEYPHTGEKGAQRLQVIDDAALDAMVNSFRPKVLIDQEHFSYDSEKSSEAFGWIAEVQKRADGLYGRIEWTDLGTAAVTNKRYRFVSPVWLPRDVENLGGSKVRPRRLDSVGLTNTPNLRGMVPLSNRDGAPAPAATTTNNRTPTMKSIATKLGLSAEASEDAILAAVTQIMNRAEGAEGKVTALTTERDELKNRVSTQDDEQIEAEFDQREVEEAKRAKLRPVLKAMKNREERVEFLNEVIGEPGEEPETPNPKLETASGRPVLNRNAAKTPKPAKAGKADITPQKLNAEVRAFMNRAGIKDYTEGFNGLRAEKPELFGLPQN